MTSLRARRKADRRRLIGLIDRSQFKRARKLVMRKQGIWLDISYGGEQQVNALRMGPGGDIEHDPLQIPFPLPDKCAIVCVVTHVLEYLPQERWYPWWDELHRIMKTGGTVYASGPHGGDESHGWLSDPTHKTRVIEQSFLWLDPRAPFYAKHEQLGRKPPLPWHPQSLARVPGAHGTYTYNVVLQPQGIEQ